MGGGERVIGWKVGDSEGERLVRGQHEARSGGKWDLEQTPHSSPLFGSLALLPRGRVAPGLGTLGCALSRH